MTLFVAAFAGPAVGGPKDSASVAMRRGDYATALRLLLPLGEHGDAEAEDGLGHLYASGRADKGPDFVRAYMWFSLAAMHHPPGNDRDTNERNFEGLAHFMSPAEVELARELVRNWRPR